MTGAENAGESGADVRLERRTQILEGLVSPFKDL